MSITEIMAVFPFPREYFYRVPIEGHPGSNWLVCYQLFCQAVDLCIQHLYRKGQTVSTHIIQLVNKTWYFFIGKETNNVYSRVHSLQSQKCPIYSQQSPLNT